MKHAALIVAMISILWLSACGQGTATPIAGGLGPTPTGRSISTPVADAEAVRYSGSGNQVIEIEKPTETACLLHVEGNESSAYFGVSAYAEDGKKLETYVDTILPYDGTRMLDLLDSHRTATLEVEAEGPWSIELLPLTPEYVQDRLLESQDEKSGTGDEILLVKGDPQIIRLSHQGKGRLVVKAYGMGLARPVFNRRGDHEGEEAILPVGTVFLEILTEGRWTIGLD